jgi:hypothetical protein
MINGSAAATFRAPIRRNASSRKLAVSGATCVSSCQPRPVYCSKPWEIEPTAYGCVLHHRETLLSRALLPWLPAVIAPRLKPHIVQRLADIRDLLESRA